MEAINRNNYEVFFLDYHEGNLSGEEMAQVVLFLESNADLKEEFYSFKNMALPDDSVLEPTPEMDKTSLYQGPVFANRHDYFVASFEGDLSESEQVQLAELISENPELEKELQSFSALKLEAEPIIFEEKEDLKKSPKVIPLFAYGSAATVAAMLVLYFTLPGSSSRDYSPTEHQFADIEIEVIDTSWDPEERIVQVTEPVKDLNESSKPLQYKRADLPAVEKLVTGKPKPIEFDQAAPQLAVSDEEIEWPKQTPELAKKREPQTLLSQATKIADHKIIGTPKAETTAAPIELLEKGIEKVTKKKTEITKENTSERKKFAIQIGKFSYSKSSSFGQSEKKRRKS